MTSAALPPPVALPRRGRRVAGLLLRLSIAGCAALLVANALPYFGGAADDTPFLVEKGALAARPAWRAAFFVHVGAALVCLVAGVPLLSGRLLRRAPTLHRAAGWTYVVAAVLGVVPSGLVLAPTANGGLAGRTGFALIGLTLLGTTLAGLRHVLRRDFRAHRAWMLRSFAMAATALSFRLLYAPLVLLDAANPYGSAVWASFAVDVVIAEHAIESLSRRSPA